MSSGGELGGATAARSLDEELDVLAVTLSPLQPASARPANSKRMCTVGAAVVIASYNLSFRTAYHIR
jgi:hypothetical protein